MYEKKTFWPPKRDDEIKKMWFDHFYNMKQINQTREREREREEEEEESVMSIVETAAKATMPRSAFYVCDMRAGLYR